MKYIIIALLLTSCSTYSGKVRMYNYPYEGFILECDHIDNYFSDLFEYDNCIIIGTTV